MSIPVDIHTHRPPAVTGTAILNCAPEDFSPEPGGWYSVGIHPWQVTTDSTTDIASEHFKKLIAHPQVVAVGETGIDKLTDVALDLQTDAFRRQALLAEEAGKPLIIHQVHAAEELLLQKRLLRPRVPWIIHGFRGKATVAKMFLSHHFYLSFGERYREEALLFTPADRLFLETDESMQPAEDLYRQAAELRGVPEEVFRRQIEENIRKVFYSKYTYFAQ